jgi:hypothetical protein
VAGPVNSSTANESGSALDLPAEDSRVCSSTIGTILIGRPSVVTSNWKSTAYTPIRVHPRLRSVVRRGHRADDAVALEAVFVPKALHFLVIDCPAFCTGVVIPGRKWRSQDRNVASGWWG